MEVRNEKYSACLRRGKITVVRLQQGKDRKLHWTFPSGGGASDASCVEIALDFLIYGTKNGDIVHYLLEEDAPLLSTTFHHLQGIKRLWVNVIGTRVILEDEMEHLFVYNPVSQETSLISETDNPDNVLWDSDDSNVVVISKGHEDMVFIYSSASVSPKLMFVGLSTTRPAGFVPLALQNGVLTSQQGSAPVQEVILETHKWIKGRVESQAERRMRFDQNIALFHFKEAWNDAIVLNEIEVWDALAKQALGQMDLDLALKACQQAKDVKMQMLLRPLEHIEDKYLFAGHVMTIFGEHDTAQDYFLKSIHPQSAVDLRMSLQQWDRALPLAVQLDSPSIHDIKWHYAQWLERKGEYRQSVMHYQDTLKVCLPDTPRYSQAKTGLARALIHVGDIWKGKQLAIECNDTRLFGECAKILEGLNLLQDAAELYEMGKQPQRATRLYIAARNYSKACLLVKELDSLMFYNEYGRAMDGERKYSDASAAYEAGEDFENVVRLELGPLNNPSRAYSVVYETKSISGAFLAAKFCKGNGDYERAIEFFIMAKRRDEARELAQLHGKMDVYTGLVVDIASTEERLTLAKYYESTGNYTQAGLLFERCNETKKALNLYLQWGSAEGIDQAIAMVGRLKAEELISQLFDFLTDATRAEKTQKHLQRLHTVLGHYEQATKAAKLIADQEREAGNYRSGHQLLLDYCRTLQDHGKQVPSELLRQLMLLHSYILVKTLIRLENHRLSARMLIRIVKNISMFPAHVVQILTSAVIECQRSGLKKSAFDYASMLMNPEYRQMIAPAYKRKIEKIVRKPEKVEDEEPLSPCPVCSLPIPETQLDCPACGSNIPFCIVSGRHMVLEDWTTCPSCKFPALMSEFLKMLEVEKTCPMCSQPVAEEDLVLVNPDLKK
ncbi:WD repeat-containing protein 19 [Selaginella moellendorffii]|uniref:WD repeat-containing protein 19 n=1 Tax=Selaginella moellendorffii TaxID=88036 RepID=UPI000D1CF21E|nr:WD repeat-containing protein 19 [Selaginella moellendorffii]|eukprot:XP_024544591.1 WD repeat-containing protein 19 [Selaginella moellendorffii]